MDMSLDDKAYQSDGKKRRSFLPAPKKSSGTPQTSAHAPLNSGMFEAQSPTLPPPGPEFSLWNSSASLRSSSSGEAREQGRAPSTRSHQTERVKADRKIEQQAFGVGLRIGARVKIGGVKPGILRYLGTTHFSSGIFCGIELYDPDGNHDGKVHGHRYFICAPNHGIFAPKEKVCLDTSSSMERLSYDSDYLDSSSESLNENCYGGSRNYGEREYMARDFYGHIQGGKHAENIAYLQHSGDSRSHRKQVTQPPYPRGSEHEWLEFQKYREQQYTSPDHRHSRTAQSGPVIETSQHRSSGYLPARNDLLSQVSAYHSYHSGVSSVEANAKNQISGHTMSRSSPSYGRNDPRYSEDSEEDVYMRDTLSQGVKNQLRADSRHYLNFTFDRESLNRSFDREDSGSDSSARNRGYIGNTAHPRFIPNASGDLYQDGRQRMTGPMQQFVAPPGSITPSRNVGVNLDTYAKDSAGDIRYMDSNAPISKTDSEGGGFSKTHKDSSQDLYRSLPSRAGDEVGLGSTPSFRRATDDQRLSEGGYVVKYSGGGTNAVLNNTQISDRCKSQNYPPRVHSGRDVGSPHRYAVRAGDAECKSEHSPGKNNDAAAAAAVSRDSSILRSDLTPSSSSRPSRKTSAGSSVSSSGDSLSHITDSKASTNAEVKKKKSPDDGSSSASSEVSQNLEWYYEQGLDERIAQDRQENVMTASTSTGTSESMSDALRDISDQLDEEGGPRHVEDSDQFEASEEFENIDYPDDYPGFDKNSRSIMTDSGISEKEFDLYHSDLSTSRTWVNVPGRHCLEDDASSISTNRTLSSESSQETLVLATTPRSVEDISFLSDDARFDDAGSRSESLEDRNSNRVTASLKDSRSKRSKRTITEDRNEGVSRQHDVLSSKDLVMDAKASSSSRKASRTATDHSQIEVDECYREGRVLSKKERPLSLLSTTSADTGYAPDTDSELGTLTTNTPSIDWLDKVGSTQSATQHATQLGEPSGGCTDLSGEKPVQPKGSKPSGAVPGVGDEDDHSSIPPANTEDERVEADQVLEQSSKRLSGASADVTSKEEASSDADDEDDEGISKDQDSDSGGVKGSIADSAVKEEEENQEGKSPEKEESVQQSTTKSRKTIVITKKRSENVDHKMPNINVVSRLADYIKAPVPVKPKEDKEKEQKKKMNKNVKNTGKKSLSITELNGTIQDVSRSPSVDKDLKDNYDERSKVEKADKPKPIIKRAPPKSKWGNIMSQIEANKDTGKPKLMSEVKSPLAAYLSAPPPQTALEGEAPNKREFKSKLKQLPPPPPKIDFSKIKSKLNVPTAASAMKATPKREPSSHPHKAKNEERAGTTSHKDADDESEGNVVLLLDPVADGGASTTGSHTDLNMSGSTEATTDPHTKEGVQTKPESHDQNKKDDRRMSSASFKSENTDVKAAPVRAQKKGAAPPANQSRKSQVTNTTRSVANISSTKGPRTFTTRAALKEEVDKLELLCEAKIKEVMITQMQLEAVSRAFDAMAVVVNYCNSDLKAFECPAALKALEDANKQLELCVSELADLNSQNEALNKNLDQVTREKAEEARQKQEALERVEKMTEEHSKLIEDLNNTHNTALSSQRQELSAKHDEAMKKFGQFHEIQIQLLGQTHERQVADMTNENKLETNRLKISHLEEIQELRNKHDMQVEEIHQQHRNKLDDMTCRYDSIKLSLLEKVESLRKECEGLAYRARNSEEALRRDADVKVQMALSPYLSLPSEIESLKAVQEMRIEEIQKLRTKNMDLEKQLEEIFIAREKIISLQQKVESLEAIINIKTEHEKQLHEKCQVLMRKYDRQFRANKRISMDYEQVMWRMSQSQEFGSDESLTKQQLGQSAHSGSGPSDSYSRGTSPGGSRVDLRKRSSNSVSESERKLRSRSAVLSTERSDSGDSNSPSPSPRMKQRCRKKTNEAGTEIRVLDDRMCQSAGPELMSNLLSDAPEQQKNWGEQNVSIVLTDLTRSQVASASDMAGSYARSLSGVTDSGVYDSLTRSDVLDSSMVSTDSEWATSAHHAMKCDTTSGFEYESGPPAGDYNSVSESGPPAGDYSE